MCIYKGLIDILHNIVQCTWYTIKWTNYINKITPLELEINSYLYFSQTVFDWDCKKTRLDAHKKVNPETSCFSDVCSGEKQLGKQQAKPPLAIVSVHNSSCQFPFRIQRYVTVINLDSADINTCTHYALQECCGCYM